MIKFEKNQRLFEYYYFNEPLNNNILNQIDFTVQNLEYELAKTSIDINDSNYYSDDNIRRSNIKWIYPNIPEHTYLFECLSSYIKFANEIHYNLDIVGSEDGIQYTEYNSEMKGHYDWHIDIGEDINRKLSIVVQLSSPDEYEGGDLEIYSGVTPMSIPKKKGYVLVFPSFLLHRVTPVTKGIRKSLVWWVGGSQFR